MNIQPQQMEMFVASRLADSLGGRERLLELILERRNMLSDSGLPIRGRTKPCSCNYVLMICFNPEL